MEVELSISKNNLLNNAVVRWFCVENDRDQIYTIWLGHFMFTLMFACPHKPCERIQNWLRERELLYGI